MAILIMGANGNMGKRYAAILNYLGKEYIGVDVNNKPTEVAKALRKAEGVIVATPTETHLRILSSLKKCRKPILCEKPISKHIPNLSLLLDQFHETKTPLNMVYQYKELVDSKAFGESEYNYFKHGSDGLVWDCIQIIGLAKGNVTIREDSPVWKCQINGEPLDIGLMDLAYIHHIKRWLKRPGQSLTEILDIHMKAAALARGNEHGRSH